MALGFSSVAIGQECKTQGNLDFISEFPRNSATDSPSSGPDSISQFPGNSEIESQKTKNELFFLRVLAPILFHYFLGILK